MKKLIEINTVCNGSTGKIMCDIAKEASKSGYQSYCFYGRGRPNKTVNCFKIENKIGVLLHILLARLGFNGHGSYFATKRLVNKIRDINPDVIHLHNIHGYYLNFKVLFKYFKNEYKGRIIWTLHDCWSFTGHCAYFTVVECNKWCSECHDCPQLFCYPKTLFDTTKKEYLLKKSLFTGINNLTILTPSIWLKELVKKSFLRDYDVDVIQNGIDVGIFKPTFDDFVFEKYNIPKNKKIILGVANVWEKRKGFDDFVELSKYIDKTRFQIVLVGVNQKDNKVPNDIITIPRTDNAHDLAKIYSIAYVLYNPTYEDNYPTVNLESIACKTPIVTYDTGGCMEQIKHYNGGFIINKKDYQEFIKILDKIPSENLCNVSVCDNYNMMLKYINYIK